MNIVRPKRGDWFLIPADVPHCYIQGEIMECMINSDNVVRGGLTPKLKDIQTLLGILPFQTFGAPAVWGGEVLSAKEGSYSLT